MITLRYVYIFSNFGNASGLSLLNLMSCSVRSFTFWLCLSFRDGTGKVLYKLVLYWDLFVSKGAMPVLLLNLLSELFH